METNQLIGNHQLLTSGGVLGSGTQEETSLLGRVDGSNLSQSAPRVLVVTMPHSMRCPRFGVIHQCPDESQHQCESLSTLSRDSQYIYCLRKDFISLFCNAEGPLMLTQAELTGLLGANESLTLAELNEFYLPMVQHITLKAKEHLKENPTETFVVGIAGSVAVGKSTTARVIHALLLRSFERATLVSTDNFLYPTAVLEEKGIMHRKGFPESFDQEAMLDFFQALKDNKTEVHIPIYDHISYDILKDRTQLVSQPDVLVLEGLNVLQPYQAIEDDVEVTHHFSDHLHYSVYVDAKSEDIKKWYIDRFLSFRNNNLSDKNSRWQKYAGLSEEEVIKKAGEIWDSINGLNLKNHIEPSKYRADLIIEKSADHSVEGIKIK